MIFAGNVNDSLKNWKFTKGTAMNFSREILDELEVLGFFDSNSRQEGIKVHASADPRKISAAERLFAKGLISQVDGGYLTPLGVEAFDKATKLLAIMEDI